MEYMYEETTKELLNFIKKSPTCFHVVANIASILENAGYTLIDEGNTWNLVSGGKYFVIRGGSSIIAFRLPKITDISRFGSYQIVAAHSDSPCFKIKENPEIISDNRYVSLNVEKYGGMIMSSWMDRPLSVAGRVVVTRENEIARCLIDVDRDLLAIPNLAIHFNREINEGYKFNPQKDMIPLFGDIDSKDTFDKMIKEEVSAELSDDSLLEEREQLSVLSLDLFLYNRQEGTIWGKDNEYFSAPRIDDIQCAYSAVASFVESENENNVTVCAVFNNEEVGSTTKQGADSTFLSDVLERISINCNKTRDEYLQALSSSFMISADNAHGVHPNHTDKSDPTNRPYMNGGIVIKYNANQKYSTDAVSAAIMKKVCLDSGVPYQTYVNRSDMAGGSTLGNISNSHISVNTVDIGLAQLAMHSAYETGGVKDTAYMIRALRHFYNEPFSIDGKF